VSASEAAAAHVEQGQNHLIRAIQAGVPFARRPFERIGAEIGLSGDDVLEGLHLLRDQGILREISAVLEGHVLGYDSAVVAGVVPAADLDRVVAVVNAHPTVTHNYLRNHHYNLWFTVAVPREMSLEETVRILASEGRVPAFYALRRTRVFKIGVNFDPETRQNRSAVTPVSKVEPIEVSERDARLFRALQTPLPLAERPFDELATREDVDPEEILAFGRRHLGGAIRRYIGTLRHRKLGVRANAMVVWRVADEQLEEAGLRLAGAPEVSHCYARNAIDGFPYTLYSMVHGPDQESCREVAERLAREAGIADYAVLFSEREFKKVRLRYFLPELDAWWALRAGSSHPRRGGS
jgi:DNA-binding Lrp family transcriptional regulator